MCSTYHFYGLEIIIRFRATRQGIFYIYNLFFVSCVLVCQLSHTTPYNLSKVYVGGRGWLGIPNGLYVRDMKRGALSLRDFLSYMIKMDTMWIILLFYFTRSGSGFRPMELHHAQSSYTVKSSASSSPFKALLSTPFKKCSKNKKKCKKKKDMLEIILRKFRDTARKLFYFYLLIHLVLHVSFL